MADDKLNPKAGDVFQVLVGPVEPPEWARLPKSERPEKACWSPGETFEYGAVAGLNDIDARLETLARGGYIRRVTNVAAAKEDKKAAAEEPEKKAGK